MAILGVRNRKEDSVFFMNKEEFSQVKKKLNCQNGTEEEEMILPIKLFGGA